MLFGTNRLRIDAARMRRGSEKGRKSSLKCELEGAASADNISSWLRARGSEAIATLRCGAQYAAFFVPAGFFLLIAVCAVFAPHLVVAAVAAFFLFLGAAASYLAWKFILFKRKFDEVAHKIEARIYFHSGDRHAADREGEPRQQGSGSIDMKDIILH